MGLFSENGFRKMVFRILDHGFQKMLLEISDNAFGGKYF
jgi:hypothetical protein